MIKRCKKAVLSSSLIGIIMAVVIALVLVIFTPGVIHAANGQNIMQKCHFSVAASTWQYKAHWVIDWHTFSSPYSFDCKTIYTVITKDGIKTAGDDVKLKTDKHGDQTTDTLNQLKDVVMSNMKDCWYMYGEGKYQVQNADVETGTDEACIVCSEIIMDSTFKTQFKDGITLDKMYDYAYSEEKALSPDSHQEGYTDYFLEGSTQPAEYPGKGITDGSSIVLGGQNSKYGQYSIVFVVTNRYNPFVDTFTFNGKSTDNVGIVDCYGGNQDMTNLIQSRAQTCAQPTHPSHLIFGQGSAAGYPQTVRLMPTTDLSATCRRLY